MITDFKIFENNSVRVFWEVTTIRPYFQIMLWKLGMPEHMIEKFDNVFDKNSQKNVFICFRGYDPDNYLSWIWGESFSDLIKSGYKFKKKIVLYESDIEKYELQKNVKKYNL